MQAKTALAAAAAMMMLTGVVSWVPPTTGMGPLPSPRAHSRAAAQLRTPVMQAR